MYQSPYGIGVAYVPLFSRAIILSYKWHRSNLEVYAEIVFKLTDHLSTTLFEQYISQPYEAPCILCRKGGSASSTRHRASRGLRSRELFFDIRLYVKVSTYAWSKLYTNGAGPSADSVRSARIDKLPSNLHRLYLNTILFNRLHFLERQISRTRVAHSSLKWAYEFHMRYHYVIVI